MRIDDFMTVFEAGLMSVRFSNPYDRSNFLKYLKDNDVSLYSQTARYIDMPNADEFMWDYICFSPQHGYAHGVREGNELAKRAIQYEDLVFGEYRVMNDSEFKVALDDFLGVSA